MYTLIFSKNIIYKGNAVNIGVRLGYVVISGNKQISLQKLKCSSLDVEATKWETVVCHCLYANIVSTAERIL